MQITERDVKMELEIQGYNKPKTKRGMLDFTRAVRKEMKKQAPSGDYTLVDAVEYVANNWSIGMFR